MLLDHFCDGNNFHVSLCLICHPSVSDITMSPGPLASDGENNASVSILYYITFDVSPKQHTGNRFLLNFHQAPGLDLLTCHCRTICFVFKSLSGGPLFREHGNRKLLKFATQKYFKKISFDRIVK